MKYVRLIFKGVALLLGLSIIAIIVLYNGFVWIQMGKVPSKKSTLTVKYPPDVQKIFWVCEFGNKPLMKMKPYPFWKFIYDSFIVWHLSDLPASFRAASMAGNQMIYREYPNDHTRSFDAQLRKTFTAIWISKHWTAEQTTNYILDSIYWGHEFRGIVAASKGYFGVQPQELSKEEIVFLAGIVRRPAGYDPWCDPEHTKEATKRFLQDAEKEGVEGLNKDPSQCFKRLVQNDSTQCNRDKKSRITKGST
jgi:transglycosylase-like protein